MFTSFVGWVKGLSAAGKVALSVVTLVGVGAMAAPGLPANPPESDPSVPKVQAAEVTTVTVTETEPVAFSKKTVETDTLNNGTTQISTIGIDGIKTRTYTITMTDGVETSRVLTNEEVTTAPVDEITSIGTYVVPVIVPRSTANCDPNYTGACVPIASDVDCGGGSGNGPAYVFGTVQVVGYDIYDLDRDGDGYGCE